MAVARSRRNMMIGLLGGGMLTLSGAAWLRRDARAAEAGRPAEWPGAEASCREPAAATPRQTEGPFFTPSTPLKSDFRADGRPGRPLDLVGTVVDRDCRPLTGVVVELWHADADGRYDNSGYDLRGHQVSDDEGRFGFETIVPGLYSGRTRHYHLIVAPSGGRPLTTQLYFPDEPRNGRDWIYDPLLQMRLEGKDDHLLGRYDFVVG